MVSVPVALGVKLTEQVPAAKVQLPAVKVPAAIVVKLTVPVGVDAVPEDVSATVALQVLALPTTTGLVHETVVVVERPETVSSAWP